MKRILEEFRLGFNVLVRTGVMIYGYLGTVLLVSVFWFLGMTPVLLWVGAVLNQGDLSLLVMSIPIFALGAVPTAAALYVVNKAFHKESVSPLDFLIGIKKFFFRSYALGLLFLVVLSVMLYDLWFFLVAQKSLVFNIIGGLWIYVIIYVVFVGYYLLGFLVEQDIGIRKAIKRSAMVVLDNFFFSMVVTLMFAIVGAASLILPVFFLLTGGALAFVIQNSTAAILKKYGAFELRPGEYGGHEGPVKDEWKGLPDPRKDPEFYGMTEEEVKRFHEDRRKKRLGADD
ncbi:MAG: DUF624 domain-containing protein [Firmicutes bacterium]|nr:DUF624 domain-containing protein [Bacillota bacterium]